MPAAKSSAPPSLTQEIAAFVAGARLADVPAAVLHHAKRSFLDGLGLALAGSVSEGGHLLRDYLLAVAPSRAGGCTEPASARPRPSRKDRLA